MANSQDKEERYMPLVRFNGASSNLISYLNPWIPLWWSAALPGYGHFLLGNNLTAYILVIFEFVMNTMSHLNEAIYRSMIGDIKGAREVLDLRWFFGYIGVFVFAMYDSYSRTVENNKLYILAYRYTQKISFASLSTLNQNTIEKSSPVMGMFWSFITPGLGAVFTHRLPIFIFCLVTWGATVVKSRLFEALYYSAVGDFSRATSVLDPQWYLFVPSLLGFSMYFGYRETVNANKQFSLSQAQYLKKAYQNKKFIKPV